MNKTENPNICKCICHFSSSVRHFLPCCRGQCQECSEYIKDFIEHKSVCENTEDPVMALMADYQRRRQEPVYLFRMSYDEEDKNLYGFKDGSMWHFDGEVWARLVPLRPEDRNRTEVQAFRV